MRAVPTIQKAKKSHSLIRDMRVPRLAFLLLFLIASLGGAVEKPFNFNETPGKLPKEVVPTEDAIRIVPNLDNFTVAGRETAKVDAPGASPWHGRARRGHT